jgi:hypothetical protein
MLPTYIAYHLGIYLLVTHRTLGVLVASRVTISPQRNLRNAFLFGIAYARLAQ